MICYHCMQSSDKVFSVCPCCGNPSSETNASYQLKRGTILSGKYLIGKVLGEGGFGITYIGKDINLDIMIAIKEYYPKQYANRSSSSDDVEITCEPELKEYFTVKSKDSFLFEARTLAKFSKEANIVNVRDYFACNQTAYIIMDYIDGPSLKTYLLNHGCLSIKQVMDWFIPLMKALARIHFNGLIHRDISPDNILIEDGRLVLIDFGACRDYVSDSSISVITKKGYAPIEQYSSHGQQGAWTDIYALCATMYHCLTGKKPIASTDRILNDSLQPPSALGVSIPTPFEKALMKGLSNRYQERQSCVEQLITELEGSYYADEATLLDDSEILKNSALIPHANKINNDSELNYSETIIEKDTTKIIESPETDDGDSVYDEDQCTTIDTGSGFPSPIINDHTNSIANKNRARYIILLTSVPIILGFLLFIVVSHFEESKQHDLTSITMDDSSLYESSIIDTIASYVNETSSIITTENTSEAITEDSFNSSISTSTIESIYAETTNHQQHESIPQGNNDSQQNPPSSNIQTITTPVGSDSIVTSITTTHLYKYTVTNGTVSINGINQNISDLSIPKEIEGFPVVAISSNAFSNNTNIRSIYLPDGIQQIGDHAFSDCINLTELSMPDSISYIGEYAFKSAQFSSVRLSNNLSVIKAYSFYGNPNLDRIVIPPNVNTIENYAFGQCELLETICIPISVLKIETGAFAAYPPFDQSVYYGGSSAQWDLLDISSSAFTYPNLTPNVRDFNDL